MTRKRKSKTKKRKKRSKKQSKQKRRLRKTTKKKLKRRKKKKHNPLVCGEGHRGLVEIIVDNSDFDAKALVLGNISKEKITFYSGSNVEKEYDFKDVALPVLTIDDRCFSIRTKNRVGSIFCAKNLKSRDKWLNRLHEAILCKITGVKGILLEEPGKAVEKKMAEVEQKTVEEPPSGINIHIGDTPDGKKPNIVINGMSIGEVEDLQRQRAVADVMPQPPKPSITDFPNPALDSDPQVQDQQNNIGQPKSQEEIDALNEALAEQKQIPLSDERVPKLGYAMRTMSS